MEQRVRLCLDPAVAVGRGESSPPCVLLLRGHGGDKAQGTSRRQQHPSKDPTGMGSQAMELQLFPTSHLA